MHHILSGRQELIHPAPFPDFVDLSAFMITRGSNKNIEWHHHTYEEAWLWCSNTCTAWVEGLELTLCPNDLLIVPKHRAHAFAHKDHGENTLIVPRLRPGQDWGHRHQYKIGEALVPEHNARQLPAAANTHADPAVFAGHWFARHMYGAAFTDGATIFERRCEAWAALLVRAGRLHGSVDGDDVSLGEDQCLCLEAGSRVALSADGDCDLAVVIGHH